MSATGLKVFDETLHTTHAWLKEIADLAGLADRQSAYRAFRGVMHALRDRLPVSAAAHLGAQLPMLLRGVYYEGWRPAATPTDERTAAQFKAHATALFEHTAGADPDAIVTAVFEVLRHRISPGEVEDVKRALPEEIRALWP